MSGPVRRVALIGGAFNPPHEGHRRLAELALDHLKVDEVRFVPTAASPHKPGEGPEAQDGALRARLLEALLETLPPTCSVERIELERGGVSYTVDTLKALHQREPGTAWILVMGLDQAKDLDRWHRVDRILERASVAVAPRPGIDADLPEALRFRVRPAWSGAPGELVWLPGTAQPLASSDLRARLREGERPTGIRPEVLAAITAKNLYRE